MKINIQNTETISHTEHAYNLIKEKIIKDEFKQSTVVSILSLADELSIGRTPVTIACKQLEHEGLLKIIPKRGVLINPLTSDDVRELYESRIAIEIFLAGKAFNFIEKKDIQVLEASIVKQKDYCDKKDPYAYMEEDTFFHRYILEKYDNKILMHMHHNLSDRILLFGIRNSKSQERILTAIATHEAIVSAIKSRERTEFLKQLEFHFVSGYSFLTSLHHYL